MIFNIRITNVQHIDNLNFSIDLSKNRLMCIAGKNGIGKTSLIRAIYNLKSTDTFQKTASPYIFNTNSSIDYQFDNEYYSFKYNEKLNLIDTTQIINDKIKSSIHVELPMPHGTRFNHFQKLSVIDQELRSKISLGEYDSPDELIDFLSNVYNTSRFKDLKGVKIKREDYHFILQPEDYYIREDYLSSGEYFVISLYKVIQQKRLCIAIDEIDISLDASAQVNLINELRNFCNRYEVNIVFTTHSLPLMKTLDSSELYYMEENERGNIEIEAKSYNYLKSILFGFYGWDKYILTEDDVLADYINHSIQSLDHPIFYKYKVIFIGGADNVVGLMERNGEEGFLSAPENVITVLDGDQKDTKQRFDNGRVFFIPFMSIEKDLLELYRNNNEEIPQLRMDPDIKGAEKNLYNTLIDSKRMTRAQIFDILNRYKNEESSNFKETLLLFLSK